jgi:hypothetical protein
VSFRRSRSYLEDGTEKSVKSLWRWWCGEANLGGRELVVERRH